MATNRKVLKAACDLQQRRRLGNALAAEKSEFTHSSSRQQRPFSSLSGGTNNNLSAEEAGRRAYERASAELSSRASGMNTILAHAGISTAEHNAPQAPPLHLATTYTRPPDGPYHEGDSIYTRMDNPTRLLLETTVGQLECHGGRESETKPCTCAFSSGMAAVSSVFLAHTSPVKVLIPKDVYHGIPTVLEDVLSRHGIVYQAIDYTTDSSIEKAISEANESEDLVLWMESPSNPRCQVIDIAAVCDVASTFASKKKITTVVDATMTPPCITQPLMLGADVAVHAATKYMGGHSDVLLGLVTTSPWTDRGKSLAPVLRQLQISMGAVGSSFDSWLTLRGLRTLHVRLERQCQTALALARHLSEHRLVTAVHYPGLESHPQHDIATRQMNLGYGGVLSIEVENEIMAMAVAGAVGVMKRATSLGGTETLIEHRQSIEPPSRQVSPPGLLRISVGVEQEEDLIADLDYALSIAEAVYAEATK